MAIKKKMAGKPAMKTGKAVAKKPKLRKAQGGITLASNPDTDEKNALDLTKSNKDLSEVKVRPGFGKTIQDITRSLYKTDIFNSNKPGRSTAGKAWRKVANGVVKGGLTPSYLAGIIPFGGIAAAERLVRNQSDLNKIPEKKMGGKVSKAAPKMMKKAAPKMAMKKMSKKK